MKFCPECGSPLKDTVICSECGYNYETKTINEEILNKKIEEERKLNELSNDNNIGTMYIDEIPKDLPAIYTMNEQGFVVLKAINKMIGESISNKRENYLEEDLYKLYKNNKLPKEVFIKELEDILSRHLEDNLRTVINKINND